MIRTTRAFNTEGQSDAHSPVWIALNPQKGDIDRKPGWEEEERLRRLAAAFRHEDTTSCKGSAAGEGRQVTTAIF